MQAGRTLHLPWIKQALSGKEGRVGLNSILTHRLAGYSNNERVCAFVEMENVGMERRDDERERLQTELSVQGIWGILETLFEIFGILWSLYFSFGEVRGKGKFKRFVAKRFDSVND